MKDVINTPLLRLGLTQYGITEQQGINNNPEILKYFKDLDLEWIQKDETAWCSAYVNWVALRTKRQRSGSLKARSWLKVGQTVKQPKLDDIVIFWREKRISWKGHVGFFISYSEDKRYIYCLGGNQNNQVNISAYPAYRLLGFRRLYHYTN